MSTFKKGDVVQISMPCGCDDCEENKTRFGIVLNYKMYSNKNNVEWTTVEVLFGIKKIEYDEEMLELAS